jgi:hypothetical protein
VLIALGLAVVSLLGTPPTPPVTPPTTATTTDETTPEPPASPPPAPPALPAPTIPRRYGDRGSMEVALGLGYSSDAGFLGAGGFRYFVFDGVAPGVEATYVGGGTRYSAFGLVLGSLRLVPIRGNGFALVLGARGGRVLFADHADGWGVGGSGGVIVFMGANIGLEIGYEALRLLPEHFCADLPGCVIHGPVFGLRVSL